MDPVTLAMITSAVTSLAGKVIDGTASQIGKDLWHEIRKWFDWEKMPETTTLAQRVAEKLARDEELTQKVVTALQKHDAGFASQLVGPINPKNLFIIQQVTTMNVS